MTTCARSLGLSGLPATDKMFARQVDYRIAGNQLSLLQLCKVRGKFASVLKKTDQ
jgi:hypothetical protein